MLLEISGEITPERMERGAKALVDVTGDGCKLQCCKERYCIGTCNVRLMNQDKLEVVKQEMARVILSRGQHSRDHRTKRDWNG